MTQHVLQVGVLMVLEEPNFQELGTVGLLSGNLSLAV